jgi:hypothetical protein
MVKKLHTPVLLCRTLSPPPSSFPLLSLRRKGRAPMAGTSSPAERKGGATAHGQASSPHAAATRGELAHRGRERGSSLAVVIRGRELPRSPVGALAVVVRRRSLTATIVRGATWQC